MTAQNKADELRPYRTFGLTLVQLMVLLGVLGIVATALLGIFI